MALTPVIITGTFTREDGSAATGTVTATLNEQIQNGTTVIEPTPILGELVAGKLLNQAKTAFTVDANDDAVTVPPGSYYSFLIQLDNAPVREFNAVVKHTATLGTVDMTELETPI
jgi:hypothetical protein